MVDADDLDSDEGDPILPEDAPSFLERIPLALQVLTVAQLAGTVRDAQRLTEQPAVLEENAAKGTAAKLAELQAAFSKDLEMLATKWMKAMGPVAGSEQEQNAQMNMIMVAAHSALGVRYYLTQRVLRISTPKERIKGLDKMNQRAARDFLNRPADGQGGIRRIK